MTSPGIRIRFTVEIIGDPSLVVEPDDLPSLDIETVTMLIEEELRLKVTLDPCDLAFLQLGTEAKPVDAEPHKPDLVLLSEPGLSNLGIGPCRPPNS